MTSPMIAPWNDWEDWQNGLYATRPIRVSKSWESIRLLSDPDEFREVAREMVLSWPVSARQNLKHLWSGRRAWIGQASCCYHHGATSMETRAAWAALDNSVQARANDIAADVILDYERGWDAETLFGH